MFLATSCIDPYFPPEIDSISPVLVIDGFINTQGASTIRLTRSQQLDETGLPTPELGASIWVEDDNGVKIFLSEQGNGNYGLGQQNFSSSRYKLGIETNNGRKFVSEFVSVKNSPPIDSVSWDLTPDSGVEISVSTHDPGSSEGYYRWTFEETWKYTSAGESTYEFNPTTREVTVRQDDIYHCWREALSTDILIASSSRLSENRISKFLLTQIPQTSERTRYQYSILVKQYAISQSAFTYWQQIKKTTEDLGTLFGPLPSQVVGNFTSVSDPAEPVLGFFAIGTVETKRIFIEWQDMPISSNYITPYDDCEIFEIMLENFHLFTPPNILLHGIPNPNGPGIIGYTYTSESCADCRKSGGTTTKPAYWPW